MKTIKDALDAPRFEVRKHPTYPGCLWQMMRNDCPVENWPKPLMELIAKLLNEHVARGGAVPE
jgi:hypothetical protein